MAVREAPKTLDETVDLPLKIDHRVMSPPRHTPRVYKPQSQRDTPPPPPPSSEGVAANTSNFSTEEPMQLGRLSKVERNICLPEGLCAYSGLAQHCCPQCPLGLGNNVAR